MGDDVVVAFISCVSLLVQPRRKTGELMSTATGFIASSPGGPVLITNRHVVTGRHNVTGEPLLKSGQLPWELDIRHHEDHPEVPTSPGSGGYASTRVQRTEALYDHDGNPRWIEHPVHGPRFDVVALPLRQLDRVKLLPIVDPPTPLRIKIAPADPISIVGFPFGIDAGEGLAIWLSGYIASEPAIDAWENLPIMLVDARTREGSSGSPVYAFRSSGLINLEDDAGIQKKSAIVAKPGWRFLGVYSGRLQPDSDVGIVWKRSAVDELLRAVPLPAVR
jgi:hypothetical protein